MNTNKNTLSAAALALLTEIVRAERGGWTLDIPGNDSELSELWHGGLILAAPAKGAPFRFITSEAFDLAFDVVDPVYGSTYGLEPRDAERFEIRPCA